MGKNFEFISLFEVFVFLVEFVVGGWFFDYFFLLEGGLKNRFVFVRSLINVFFSSFSLFLLFVNKYFS